MLHAKHHCWQARASQLDQKRQRTLGGVATAMPPNVLQRNLPPNSRLHIDLYPEACSHIPPNILNFKGLGFGLGGFLP